MATIEVTFFGKKYSISGDESEEYMLEIAKYVSEKFDNINLKNHNMPPIKAAVLTSFNIADELFKQKNAKDKETDDVIERIEEKTDILEGILK